jgi:GntR family transcriptional repressor for pyruvate dehydrogenase complex
VQDVSLATLSGIPADPEMEGMERVGDLRDGLELRMIMEPMAAELAERKSGAIVPHRDHAFPEAITRATKNERIVETLKS